MSSKPINKTLLNLYNRQQGRCFYCNAFMYLGISQNDEYAASIDHVIPRSLKRGITDNLVAACRGCNLSKGSKMHDDYVPEISQSMQIIQWLFAGYKIKRTTWQKSRYIYFHKNLGKVLNEAGEYIPNLNLGKGRWEIYEIPRTRLHWSFTTLFAYLFNWQQK